MTAYTTFKIGGTVGTPVGTRHRGIKAQQWDIADFVATNGFVAGDTETLLTIPARTILNVLAVYNDTALVLGGTPVFSLGDAGSATRYVNASSNITADVSHTVATASRTFDAAGALILTLNNGSGTVTSGKFTIVYELIDCNALPDGAPSF